MQIETYNGVPQPLPPEWARRYGIRSHRIGVSFPNGRMRVRDIDSGGSPPTTRFDGLTSALAVSSPATE